MSDHALPGTNSFLARAMRVRKLREELGPCDFKWEGRFFEDPEDRHTHHCDRYDGHTGECICPCGVHNVRRRYGKGGGR